MSSATSPPQPAPPRSSTRSSPGATTRPSLAALTGLRFFAAILVVLYHFWKLPTPAWAWPLQNIISSGYVGVSLFFLLSGFIMSYSYLAPSGALLGTRRNFYAARIARIYPAYLLGFLLAAPTDIALSLHASGLKLGLAKLFTNAVLVLSMQQAWTPFTAWAWNFPAWSVSVEAFFYLLFPFVAPRLVRLRPSRWLPAAIVLWLLSLAAPAALYLFLGPTGPPHIGDHLQMAVEFTPILRLPEFAIGILLGRAFLAGKLRRLTHPLLAPFAAAALLITLVFSPAIPHPFLAGGLLTPLFALLLLGLASGGGPLVKLLSLPVLILLGEASYGIYILQIPVSYVLHVPPPHTSPLTLLLYTLALILTALVSFRFVETPLRSRIRNRLAGPDAGRRDLTPPSPPDAIPTPTPPLANPTTRRSVLVGLASATAVTATAAIVGRNYATDHSTPPIPLEEGQWISTTQHAPWQISPIQASGLHLSSTQLVIHPDQPLQTIHGFGACFNELGWTSLQSLDPADRDRIFRELFAPNAGASFNLCRMPVGANDFSRGWYSYDETPGDFALRDFSIANDLETLVPFIHAAQRHNPGLRLWASPWSPPSWMKRNNFYAGAAPFPGQPPNGIRPDQLLTEGTDSFRLEEPYLAAYSNYFGRFIDAYRQQGIPIGMVMPQNEFNSAQPFPSCTWTPAGLARFIAHLGPVMAQRDVKVYLGTLERNNPQLLEAALADADARRHIQGVGVQWAGKGALAQIHHDHPNLDLFQSEQECGDGDNTWAYAVYCWSLLHHYLANGANAYMYWNIALPEGGESHWGWKQNSLITVNTPARTFRYNHEFYLMKHISAHVQPGARRLATSGLADALAFQNPDGSTTAVLRNTVNFARSLHITLGNRKLSATLPPNSFNTLVLKS